MEKIEGEEGKKVWRPDSFWQADGKIDFIWNSKNVKTVNVIT